MQQRMCSTNRSKKQQDFARMAHSRFTDEVRQLSVNIIGGAKPVEKSQQSKPTQTAEMGIGAPEGSSTVLSPIRKTVWKPRPKRKITKQEIAQRKQRRMERQKFREKNKRAQERERESSSEQEQMLQTLEEKPIKVKVTSWYAPVQISGLPLLQTSRSWQGTDFIERKDPVPIPAENIEMNSMVSDPRPANLFYRLGGENFQVGGGQVFQKLPGEPVDGLWDLIDTMGLESCDPVV